MKSNIRWGRVIICISLIAIFGYAVVQPVHITNKPQSINQEACSPMNCYSYNDAGWWGRYCTFVQWGCGGGQRNLM